MSTHHDDHSDHGHHGPSNFFTKYIFSTDHKIIGMQFLFTSLLFVILGGLFALGVRYQLAWPNQDTPYASLLPGANTATGAVEGPKWTSPAPEPNLALWKPGHEITLSQDVSVDGKSIPAGTRATFLDFEGGLAVTIPVDVRVSEGGAPYFVTQPIAGYVDLSRVMGAYNYKDQAAQAVVGTVVTVKGEGETPDRRITIAGQRIRKVGAAGPIVDESSIVLLPVRPEASKARLRVPSQKVMVGTGDNAQEVEVASVTLEGDAAVDALAVGYEKQALTTDAYLQLFTMHASIMIFFVIIPMLVGAFGNFLIPLMIGAKDMAFPKLNMLSFWISLPAGIVMLISFWVMKGPAGGGWTMYPTLSTPGFVAPELGTTLWIISVGLVGFSSVVGALNYITTTINMRAPGMTMFRMPLTVWSIFITSLLALFATPVLTAAMMLLLADRELGTFFFKPEGGGQVVLFQHLFWFYSHPAVYIMILPAMGVTSDVLSVFSRKPIFGYKPMVFAMAAITGLGFIVWGHHMFQSGMNPLLGTTFMASTIMIAVPSAIKTFNWLGTIWGGNVRFTPAMLNALAFVSMFVIGGLSGIFMASAPVDIQIHDTYFIVAHIHYVLFGGSMFGIFAGVYHWYPKMFGTQMNQKWGVIHFWMTFIAFNGTFFLMHVLGVGGHPRRYASIMEYPTLEHLQPLNVVMTLFAIMLGAAQIPFFYNFFVSLPRALGRAMVAFFTLALTGPIVIGLNFWGASQAYQRRSLLGWIIGDGYTAKLNALATQGLDEAALAAATSSAFWGSVFGSLFLGLVYAGLVFAVVFAVWEFGRRLNMPALLQRALYVVFLPLFLAPMLLKQDLYLWLGSPGLVDARWLFMILSALPGLIYLLAAKPRDEFGFYPGTNPWNANSLEWATSSPPPHLNFDEIPTVYRGPYEYSSPVVEEDYLPQPKRLPAGVVEPAAH